MTDLSKCGKDGCEPVEQIRGEHHKGDKTVHMDNEIASDMRIACLKCGKATGWDRVDTEQFVRKGDGDYRRETIARDGNKENVRARWNEMVK
jgi:hypothetical protein